MLVALFLCISCCLGAQVPAGEDTRSTVRDFLRPAANGGFATGAEPSGMYERKTQAPLVWLNMHKSKAPARQHAWFNMPFKQEAQQAIGALKAVA